MLLHGFSYPFLLSRTSTHSGIRVTNIYKKNTHSTCCRPYVKFGLASVSLLAAAVMMTTSSAFAVKEAVQEEETLSNIPEMLSGECLLPKDCKKPRIQKPKSRKAESCTSKCVGTCIRGGEGSPGEGPLNIRRPLVVFKEGFRSRKYCLVECSDICNLIGDGDEGP